MSFLRRVKIFFCLVWHPWIIPSYSNPGNNRQGATMRKCPTRDTGCQQRDESICELVREGLHDNTRYKILKNKKRCDGISEHSVMLTRTICKTRRNDIKDNGKNDEPIPTLKRGEPADYSEDKQDRPNYRQESFHRKHLQPKHSDTIIRPRSLRCQQLSMLLSAK